MALTSKQSSAIKSIAAKAASKGVSASTISSALKSATAKAGSSGGSSAPKQNTNTMQNTPAPKQNVPVPAPTPAPAPTKRMPQGADKTIAAALAAGKTTTQIAADLKKGGFDPGQVDRTIALVSKQSTGSGTGTSATGQSGTNMATGAPQNAQAQQFAAANPGAANPFSSGADGDIAMIGNKPAIKTNELGLDKKDETGTVEESISDLTVGDPYTQTIINQADETKNTLRDMVSNEVQTQLQQAQQLGNTLGQVNNELAGIINNRVNLVQQTWSQLGDRMSKLEESAKNVFDQGAARAAYAQARKLAEEGFITNDQLSSVANFGVAEYRRNADLQRAELEQELQGQYMDLLKEKQSALDSIYQDQSLNANQKAQYATQLNAVYTGISNNYIQAFDKIESTYSQNVQNALSPFSSVEAGEFQAVTAKDVEQKLQNMDYKRAFAGPLERGKFIIDYVSQNVDSSLAPHMMDIIRNEYNKPDFATRQDLPNQIAQIYQQARAKQKSSSGTASSTSILDKISSS